MEDESTVPPQALPSRGIKLHVTRYHVSPALADLHASECIHFAGLTSEAINAFHAIEDLLALAAAKTLELASGSLRLSGAMVDPQVIAFDPHVAAIPRYGTQRIVHERSDGIAKIENEVHRHFRTVAMSVAGRAHHALAALASAVADAEPGFERDIASAVHSELDVLGHSVGLTGDPRHPFDSVWPKCVFMYGTVTP